MLVENAALRFRGVNPVLQRHHDKFIARHDFCQQCADRGVKRLAHEPVQIRGFGLEALCRECARTERERQSAKMRSGVADGRQVLARLRAALVAKPAPKARPLSAAGKREYLARLRAAMGL
jgi:hypothetical protein